jgi:hypothetical protein
MIPDLPIYAVRQTAGRPVGGGVALDCLPIGHDAHASIRIGKLVFAVPARSAQKRNAFESRHAAGVVLGCLPSLVLSFFAQIDIAATLLACDAFDMPRQVVEWA